MGPDHQVKVVLHQAVSQQIGGPAGGGVGHGFHERVVIGGLMNAKENEGLAVRQQVTPAAALQPARAASSRIPNWLLA